MFMKRTTQMKHIKTLLNHIRKYSTTVFHTKQFHEIEPMLYNKPWITKGLLKSIKTKCNLYKKSLKYPSPLNITKYKKYKNKLIHLLKTSKRNFYDTKFDNAKSNLKETWKILNEIINKRKTRSKMPSSFVHNDQQIIDPLEIANKFNEYFTNVGPSLAEKLPTSTIPPDFYLKKRMFESIYF